MNTDSRTNVSAARDELMEPGILRYMSSGVLEFLRVASSVERAT
jgi:hypothetical protein